MFLQKLQDYIKNMDIELRHLIQESLDEIYADSVQYTLGKMSKEELQQKLITYLLNTISLREAVTQNNIKQQCTLELNIILDILGILSSS